jgi:GxxExxY protein
MLPQRGGIYALIGDTELTMPLDPKVPHADVTYAILGAAMRVHKRLKAGHKEVIYQRALTTELLAVPLAVSAEHMLEIYDGQVWLGRLYLDHWVNEQVIVECKSFSHLITDAEIAQVIAYLAATGAKVALLINFGRPRLDYHRILPPRKLDGWQKNIGPYLWTPPK